MATGSYSGTIFLGALPLSYTPGLNTLVAQQSGATNAYVWAQPAVRQLAVQ